MRAVLKGVNSRLNRKLEKYLNKYLGLRGMGLATQGLLGTRYAPLFATL